MESASVATFSETNEAAIAAARRFLFSVGPFSSISPKDSGCIRHGDAPSRLLYIGRPRLAGTLAGTRSSSNDSRPSADSLEAISGSFLGLFEGSLAPF